VKKINIKEGIDLHIIKTNKFKTNLLSIFLSTPLTKETVTQNALIPAVLRRGSKNITTQEQISIALEEMYGATFDCGIDKVGDNQVLKFYLETINNEFLPQKEDNLKQAIEILLEIIFNPQVSNGNFNKEYVDNEKKNLKQVIDGRKDSKASYALERCIEEMYPNAPYSLYKYGMTSELDKINSQNLYEQYVNLIKNCKIDIFISGNIEENIKDEIMENENIKKLEARKPIFIINNKEARKKEQKEEQVVNESSEVSQGKLILGLDILNENDKDKFTALVYNAILGGTPTSKMFQNVREKNSLAYTASSSFIRQKANIFIKCGIDIENYEKALKIIKEQLEDMMNGEFTDKNIEEAKNNIISTIKFIPDEQDTELMYYFSQELSGYEMGFEEYVEKVKEIKKEDIIELAKRIQINTIYFLKN
jgi:predicted Zn-dependent peptidase